MNILSFDIEEWFLEETLRGGREYKFRQFDQMLATVLDGLEDNGHKGTFFCLGKMAKKYPEVIRKIASCGYEIGCHSDKHVFLTSLSPSELKADTSDAIKSLEDVIGKKVTSYRAPAFSITPKNPWAIEILAECGIEIDSSIFPASRDLGGYATFGFDVPCRISYAGSVLKEYPITIASLLSKRIAFSGGGYFRILPYPFIRKEMKDRDYNICYFHLADLIPEKKKLMSKAQFEGYFNEPGTLKNRLTRFVKSNIGSGDAVNKLRRLQNDFQFVSIGDADSNIDWENTPIIELP